ncbi:hypothetical protein IWW35_005220 [Coemansia sp. RSA 1878]|nr:hypothetical protein IWW35_005220 [Coemansia sp. RSA 1878]
MKQPIVVAGAGVIGLTVACKLQESGRYSVVVVAENAPGELPTGEKQSTKWASPWAGAHWRAWASNQDTTLQEMEIKTYRAMMSIAANVSEAGIHVAQGIDLFEELPEEKPWYISMVNDGVELPVESLPENVMYGVQYSTLLIDVPKYLNYLSTRFKSLGGTVVKKHIDHILDATQYAGSEQDTMVIVNCTGLGSHTLGGVCDQAMYPSRGQTLLVNAPDAKRTITRLGKQFGYIIPRGNDTVIIGGTTDKNQWKCEPNALITDTIISRALNLEPLLLPVDARVLDKDAQVQALKKNIISVNVGLRPMRDGGVRLESESMRTAENGKVVVVHCYGHGGFGYQSSLAYADKVYDLVNAAVF